MKGVGAILLVALFLVWSTPVRGENIVTILEERFPEIKVRLDPVHGILTINATPEEHEEIRKILRKLDIPTPQISIETKFLELTVTELGEVMVDLDALGITIEGEPVQLEIPWDPRYPETAITFFGRKGDPRALTAVLRALEEEGEVEVISAPRVTTLNNREATIDIMVSVPYVGEITRENIGTVEAPVWVVTYHIEEEEAGVLLRVTPSVTPGGTRITLHLEPTVRIVEERLSLFGVGAELDWPIMAERTVTTQMVVESGGTVVLGGMIDSRKTAEKGRIPLLGDIPILGHLFRFQHYRDEKKMLLIFLTPHILSPAGEKIVAAR
ncbi:MAG: Type IV pilus biogenesis and competence protein PilQ [Firmicutes bacterium]|nr:Type IV pilus biogenesis and competence protein PilQ [Bacillota bacterium]